MQVFQPFLINFSAFCHACMRNERDHSTLMAFAKKQVLIYSPGSPEEKFMDVLTPYANGFVQKQLSLRSNVTMVSDNGTSCTISSSNDNLNVTTDDCQCVFWKSMHLPCRYIFLVREHLNVSLHGSDGIASRWTK